MPYRVWLSVWQGTANPSSSPTGCASLAEVSPPVMAIFRSAKYRQALMPNPGSPELNSARRLAFSSADRVFHSALSQRSPWPV